MQREVVKWAQSLDLSYPIKNPRKDLANGFLVAEILSRYDKGVSMHSFGTEMAMQQRINNWQQITKTLEKLGCAAVTKELVEGTIQQKSDLARTLLDELYMFLTKRQLKQNVIAPPVTTLLENRGYSRPTAAVLIREANDATKLRLQVATGQTDQNRAKDTNEAILKKHSIMLQSLKLAEPERYQPKKAASYAQLQQQKAETARAATDKIKTTTKEVEVRAVDDSILTTFAQRDQRAKDEALRSGFSREDDISTALSRVLHKPLVSFGLTSDLDDLFPQASEGTEYFQKFVMLRHRIPVQVRGHIWAAVHDATKSIAKHIVLRLDEGKQLLVQFGFAFSKDSALAIKLVPVAAEPTSDIRDGEPLSALYDVEQAFAVLAAVGAHLVASSAEVGARFVEQFLIPSLLPLIAHGTPAVVEGLARVLGSYVNHHHLDGIRRLVSALEASCAEHNAVPRDRFLLVVAHLLRGIDFSHCHGLDVLARFYAVEGLGSSSTVARGAAILMAVQAVEVSAIASSHAALSTISTYAVNASWELRVNALEFLMVYHRAVTREESGGNSTSRVRHEPETAEGIAERAAQLEQLVDGLPEVRQNILRLLRSFDGTRASPPQRLAAIVTAAKYLDNDVCSQDEIGKPLLHLIAQAAGSSADPVQCLHGSSDKAFDASITGRVRSTYPISGFQQRWATISIAQSLGNSLEVGDTTLSTLEAVQLIETLVLGSPNLADQAIVWEPFLRQVRHTLIVAISNPGECVGVARQDIALCAETATNAVAKLYVDLSGEVPRDEAADHMDDIHNRAMEWLQAYDNY